MKILIISDTHRILSNLREIIKKESYDRIYHLGDGEGDEEKIKKLTGLPLEIVKGNCDLFSWLSEDLILDLKGHRILLTHGHNYHVKSGYLQLYLKAKEIEAEYAFFGHTHRPVIIEEDGVVLANPGSLSYAVGDKGPSYMVLELDEDNGIHLSIKYMRDL